ncbi:hypothetical protein BsWGS_25182 [Bradybaena similaris]
MTEMGDEDLVVAVRLCDTAEAEQPDPLCLRQEDLEKWRHFESLLRGMYQNPPDAISVAYLDDESDWVQVGSDAELSEAVRLAKQGGDILQLQVKRVDTEQLITFDHTDNTCADSVDAGHFVLYIPTTDPGGETLPPLVYPHPTVDQSSGVDAPKLNPLFPEKEPRWLVYPGKPESTYLSGDDNCNQNSGNTPLLDADLQAPLRNSAVAKDGAIEYNTAPLWEGAAALSAEEKLKFMMSLMEMRNYQKNNSQDSKKPEDRCDTEQGEVGSNSDGKPKMIEPLCLEPGSLGKNFVPNQDPFEVDGNVEFFDHVMINLEKDKSPTLTPKRATNNKNEPTAKFFRLSSVETDGAASVSNTDDRSQNKQLLHMLAASKAGQSTGQGRLAYTSALPKSQAGKQRWPVPMPRNLLMMEGAQSGANAVAIEIPPESSDFFQVVTVNKEEEIAASGGAAASTSASEETGELMARGGSVASAGSRETKLSIPVVDVYAVPGDGAMSKTEKKVKRCSTKTKHSSSKKEKSAEKKQEAAIDGAKPRSSDKSERRSSEHRKKPEEPTPKEAKKEERKVKVTEDVESGEKLNNKKEATSLSRSDFAKYMKRTKKELHSAIVRDVSRLNETYFTKVVEKSSLEYLLNDIFGIREPAFHEGVYCDGCNKEIYGIRYKCGNCLDFDLCSICENQPNLHDQTHVFLKLRTPAPRAGVRKGQRHSLLVENIYEAERLRSLVLESIDDGGVNVDVLLSCKEGEKPTEQTTPIVMIPLKEQELTSVSSQNCSSPVDTENVGSAGSQDLDQTSVLSQKTVESSDSRKMCSHTTVLSLKEIVESVPLTKLQPSTPCRVRDHSEDAECDQLSPAQSDSSSSVVLVSPPAVTPATAYPMVPFDDDMNDLPELISEATVKQLTALNFDDADDDDDSDQGNSSSFEDMGSDTSDDFCVIDPPEIHLHRFDYTVIPSDVEDEETVQEEEKINTKQPVEADTTSQASEAADATVETLHNNSNPDCLDGAGETNNTVQDSEGHSVLNLKDEAVVDREEEYTGGQENCVEKEVIQGNDDEKHDEEWSARANEVSVDGLVHTMSEEEKARAPEPLSPATHIIQNVASGVSKAATTAFYTAKDVFYSLQAKQNEWKNASYNCKPQQPDLRLGKYCPQQSVEPADGFKPASTPVVPTAPAEERATPALTVRPGDVAANATVQSDDVVANATVQSDDIVANASVESGDVVVNATVTNTTDCNEPATLTNDGEQQPGCLSSDNGKPGKANARPVICWVPPRSTFKMPVSTWTPPKDDYIPPTSNWAPSKHEFIPPNIEWITTARPGKAQGAVAEADKAKEESQESSRRPSLTSSQKTPPFAALEIADTALRRELQGMQHLIEMGFANREKNRQLLNKFNNDLEKVVQSLLQEESETEDSHWAFHRH